MEPDEQISRLLRLKRHEQPPPGYFEDFLAEFQSRQRAELLKRPVWAILWDRFASTFSPTFQVPRLAYAGVAAVALIASAAIWMQPNSPSGIAATGSSFGLNAPSHPVTLDHSIPVALTSTGSPSVDYVLPATPASYASPRSF